MVVDPQKKENKRLNIKKKDGKMPLNYHKLNFNLIFLLYIC